MILVCGATGRTGKELVSKLLAHKLDVRAMVHQSGKVSEAPEEALSVVADFADRDSLKRALEGVTSAYLVSPPAEYATEWQLNFIEEARLAGVRHVVKLSLLGASEDAECRFQRSHAEIEKGLKRSGMAWTILRPNFFMQTVSQYIQGTSFFNLSGQGKVSVVDLRDVADIAAAALTESGHESSEYVLTGLEAANPEQVAERIRSIKGWQMDIVEPTEDESRFVMKQMGFPFWNAEGVLELNRFFREGRASSVTNTIEQKLGRKPRGLDSFLAELN